MQKKMLLFFSYGPSFSSCTAQVKKTKEGIC